MIGLQVFSGEDLHDMHVKSKSLVLSMILLVMCFLIGCGGPVVHNGESDDGLLIYTSIYPLYFFTKEIVGEKGEVINLIPAGMDPHDYEPTIHDVMQLSDADLFIYNGAGLESWVERIVEAVDNPELILIDSTTTIDLLNHKNDDRHEDEHHAAHTHGDPHVWLDPNLAKLQAEVIRDALVSIDKGNSELYTNNYNELATKLDNLDAQFQDLIKHAERADFVVSHAAFGHLAARYGLNQVAITGVHVEEPSTKQVQEIITFILHNDIEYILYDHLSTSKVAEVIEAEVGATSLMLHHLEGLTEEELAQGKDYFSIMEENLNVLKTALGYKKQ